MIKVSVANLGKYNEGKLISEWLELPAGTNKINSPVKTIGIDGKTNEEHFIVDYELSKKIKFDIPDHSSVLRLNEIAKELQSLDEMQLYAVQAYIELYGSDI